MKLQSIHTYPKPTLLFLVLYGLSSILTAQTDNLNSDLLKIWSAHKEYHYAAYYIESNGDTITKEKVIIKPIEKIWETKIGPNQILLQYIFNYSNEDSARLAPFPVNETPWTKKNNFIQWKDTVTEGAIENDKLLWMHSFRMNQYSLTEIAPFPTAELPLFVGKKWTSTMIIQKGWGTYKGRHKQIHVVEKKFNYSSILGKISECWLISGNSIHKKLGESQVEYVYHKKYGFIEMNYVFFNGQKISFILEDLVIKP